MTERTAGMGIFVEPNAIMSTMLAKETMCVAPPEETLKSFPNLHSFVEVSLNPTSLYMLILRSNFFFLFFLINDVWGSPVFWYVKKMRFISMQYRLALQRVFFTRARVYQGPISFGLLCVYF